MEACLEEEYEHGNPQATGDSQSDGGSIWLKSVYQFGRKSLSKAGFINTRISPWKSNVAVTRQDFRTLEKCGEPESKERNEAGR